MTILGKTTLLAVALLLAPTLASAADPVRHVAIYVEPYYAAAGTEGGTPKVAVGGKFDALLASTRQKDILAARDKVLSGPALVTPMTMMVLAIRLYDAGLRDDAAFWFYAAKDRFLTLADVVDLDADGLRQVEDAVSNFATLAGPAINGYAFCSIANQQAIRRKALAWVTANPYQAIFLPQLPAQHDGDRAAALKASMAARTADADKESAYFADPANVAQFKADRAKNETDAKYCWK